MDSRKHFPPQPVNRPFLDESTFDLFLNMILIIIMTLVIPEPHNPLDATPVGEISITAEWPDGWNTDVDLWVQAPQDRPVGYSNSHGAIFDLQRDDLGMLNDPASANHELVASRGAPEGEYVVNLHLYTNAEREYPVPVTVKATIQPKADGSAILIFEREVLLRQMGHELTVNRFSLDEEGFPIPSSVHDMPKALRGQ